MILPKDFQSHLPGDSLKVLEDWLGQLDIVLALANNRNSKYGDFRYGVNGLKSRISVNKNLNKYSFLITLTHEIAHAFVYKFYKNKKVSPHGKEWKNEFIRLVLELMQYKIFPDDISIALEKHILNPKASSNADKNLFLTLKQYDDIIHDDMLFLEELSLNQLFSTTDGRVFKKGIKRRTRFLCQDIRTKKNYSVNALLRVKPLK